jgi:hypothetical protein
MKTIHTQQAGARLIVVVNTGDSAEENGGAVCECGVVFGIACCLGCDVLMIFMLPKCSVV